MFYPVKCDCKLSSRFVLNIDSCGKSGIEISQMNFVFVSSFFLPLVLPVVV